MSGRVLQNEPIEDMVAVGAVGARSVRLWVRAPEAGALRVRCWSGSAPAVAGVVRVPAGAEQRDHTHAFAVPDDLAPADDRGATPGRRRERSLRPATRYLYTVERPGGGTVGEGRFVTAPEGPRQAPGRFAIGLLSCHQPFDARGRARPDADAMLRAAHQALGEHDARLVLTVGDQLYADAPEGASLLDPGHFARVAPPGRRDLFDCAPGEVRGIYQERYRHFWALPGWRALHADFPCYPILDDHEVVDNWGSELDHEGPGWQRVARGALDAYVDYQASRVLAVSPDLGAGCHYGLAYGPVGVFVLDVRTQRRVGTGGRLLAEEQLQDLERFLARSTERPFLAVVCPVPLLHLPRWAARLFQRLVGGDFGDRWSAAPFRADRDRLVRILRAHQRRAPQQRIVLLSGDIHIGCAHELRWTDGGAWLQLLSSGITNRFGPLLSFVSSRSIAHTSSFATEDGEHAARVRLLPAADGLRDNPATGLNLGVVEVETPRDGPPRLRYLLYGHEGDAPRCRYRSEWIGPEAEAPRA